MMIKCTHFLRHLALAGPVADMVELQAFITVITELFARLIESRRSQASQGLYVISNDYAK